MFVKCFSIGNAFGHALFFFSWNSSSALFWSLIHMTQGLFTILARVSEIDSEEDARFALSLHVFVSRLFGWTLLEGAVRGARCSLKKEGTKRKFQI